jgi:glycerol-3-phosphate acyltransferase PlsY
MLDDIGFVIVSYLFGALPHLYLLGRLRGLHLEGDLHINLWRKGGRFLGAIGVLSDIAKGAFVVLAGRLLDLDIATIAIAGLAVVAGQMWPLFAKFDGGKGNTTGIGMVATLTSMPFLVAVIPMVIGLFIRTVPRLLNSQQSLDERLQLGGPPSLSLPLGMAIGFLVLPFASWLFGEPLVVVWCYVILFILVILRRITSGLKADLEEGQNARDTLINRILYDRSKITGA